ncbi:hypothetical protein [Streptomyces sp. NPDC050585]
MSLASCPGANVLCVVAVQLVVFCCHTLSPPTFSWMSTSHE